MRIENTQTAKVFTIFDAPKLDPITVVLQDLGTGAGRLIVECWGSAWSAYWGGMGTQTLEEFITNSHPEYVAGKLEPTTGKRLTKLDRAYLMRITEAVHEALRSNDQAQGADGGLIAGGSPGATGYAPNIERSGNGSDT